MSTVTYIVDGMIREDNDTMDGKVLSRPALIYTDGINVTYACDVDVGLEGEIDENGTIGILPMKNVPIAANNMSLMYAEVGNAVTLTKSRAGHWEITGFAKTMPGSFFILPVSISNVCYSVPLVSGGEVTPPTIIIGTGIEISVVTRVLTYEELSIYGTYGLIPYGALGVFQGDDLVEIRSS